MKDFLVNSLLEMNSFNELVEAIKSKTTPIFNYGLNTQALGHIIYGLDKTLKKPMLIITKDEKEANYIYKDLKGLIIDKENIEYYPKKDVMYYNVDAVSIDTKVQRLKVLSRLVNDENIIVVSSYEALIDKIITKEDFKDNIINIDTDNEINLEVLLKKLSISGYERVEQLEGIGQFSIRGGIVDVYSPNSENPVRIELFGDEVDTIREFDLITQRSIKNINSIQITPVKEVFISDDIKDIIIENIKEEITDYNNTRVKEKFNEYIELLNENSHIKNEDMVIPFIPNEKIDSIIDYFKKDSLIFINDPKRIKENIEKDEENEILKFKDLLEAGEIT
ncbi:MAG TPA: transcription-repair coupling factor, partial [Tissierellaceae bacterium]